jgi:hypothetical protein
MISEDAKWYRDKFVMAGVAVVVWDVAVIWVGVVDRGDFVYRGKYLSRSCKHRKSIICLPIAIAITYTKGI